MKAFLARILIKLFGDIQFLPYPFFIVLWGSTHYKIKGDEMRHLTNLIKPGDVLLRRYDRYVSGWFIPGYYTHAAIAKNRTTVIHATTHGVCEEDLLTFLRADHIAVLRYQKDDLVAKSAANLSETFLGKEYDYTFMAEDKSKLFCTELVKFCYPGVLDSLSGCVCPDQLLHTDLKVVHESKVFRSRK